MDRVMNEMVWKLYVQKLMDNACHKETARPLLRMMNWLGD